MLVSLLLLIVIDLLNLQLYAWVVILSHLLDILTSKFAL